MGALIGCVLICAVLAFMYDEVVKVRVALETLAERKDVDSERCKCLICDGKVPTMKERRND